MLQAEETQIGHTQIPFSATTLDGDRPRPKNIPANANYPVAQAAIRPYEINLSGAQVLLGSAAVLGSVASFLWVLIKLWAFGR